ncbi:hypothetical protein [Streptomyces sp. NBC_00859]|nr:hypothetical protein OG584_31040 [Streptomyces sp. NBC_00859]
MFRYAFLAAPSAVADAPKAAGPAESAAHSAAGGAALFGGARS